MTQDTSRRNVTIAMMVATFLTAIEGTVVSMRTTTLPKHSITIYSISDLNKLLNPIIARQLPANAVEFMQNTLANSFHHIFVVVALISVVAFMIPLLLPSKANVVHQ